MKGLNFLGKKTFNRPKFFSYLCFEFFQDDYFWENTKITLGLSVNTVYGSYLLLMGLFMVTQPSHHLKSREVDSWSIQSFKQCHSYKYIPSSTFSTGQSD